MTTTKNGRTRKKAPICLEAKAIMAKPVKYTVKVNIFSIIIPLLFLMTSLGNRVLSMQKKASYANEICAIDTVTRRKCWRKPKTLSSQ